ncbi:MAG: hypothetical protein Q8R04_06645 [Nanoarchaeota archaeon]|nr:hypothetical protein [Nanoarchaeota archaeon]
MKKSFEDLINILIFLQFLKTGLSKDGTVNTTCLHGSGYRRFTRLFDHASVYRFPQEEHILELQLFFEQSSIFWISFFW